MGIWRLIPWAEKYGDDPERVFEKFLHLKRIALGWSLIGDLGGLHPASAADISKLIRNVPEYHVLNNIPEGGRCLWGLYREMCDRDLVILTVKGRRRAVVRIKSEYIYEIDNHLTVEDLYHRRVIEPTTMDAEALWNQHRAPATTWSMRWALVKLR